MSLIAIVQTAFSFIFQSIVATIQYSVIFVGPVFLIGIGIHLTSILLQLKLGTLLGNMGLLKLTGLGVAIHEIGHAIFCLIFFIPIKQITIFHIDNPENSVGWVRFATNKNGFIQKVGYFFVGSGPILFGALFVYFSLCFLVDTFSVTLPNVDWIHTDPAHIINSVLLIFENSLTILFETVTNMNNYLNWRYYVFLFLLICTGVHSSLSDSDVSIFKNGFVSLHLLLLILYLVFGICLNRYVAGFFNALINYYVYYLSILLVFFFLNSMLCLLFIFFPTKPSSA